MRARSGVTGPTALGLALLYASAYFLPLLDAPELYFVPSIGHDVVLPSLVTAALLAPLIFYATRRLRLESETRPPALVGVMVGVLAMIAVRSVFAAMGYSLVDILQLLAGGDVSLNTQRWGYIGLAAGALGAAGWGAWAFSSRWLAVARFMAVLGYALTVLATLRISTLPRVPIATTPIQSARAPTRRVVWIIFDELDYGETLGDDTAAGRARMPNLFRLQDGAVSARQAWLPAKDTGESIPSLLSGQPIRGTVYDGRGGLVLRTLKGDQRFTEANSVFARLPDGPASAAIVGYLHPYCKVFPSVGYCSSYYLGNIGRWFDGLTFFSETAVALGRWLPGVAASMPSGVLHAFRPMYRITDDMLQTLPTLLSREDVALTFIHLNVPHYPSDYAAQVLHLPPTHDNRETYQQNLPLVDRLIGQIEAQLRGTSAGRETLLVVSSDHWHRLNSPTLARRIPFIAWHVGETAPVAITEPISTVNTSALVVDFLNARITTHPELARWWRNQPVYPTWVPNNYER